MSYTVEFGEGPMRGAHRITLRGEASDHAWTEACRLVVQHVRDMRFRSAWSESLPLDCIGWDIGSDERRCYLAGSLEQWKACASAGMTTPTLDFVAELLESHGGSLASVMIESRSLDVAEYEQMTGQISWPWPVAGELWEAKALALEGDLTSAQLGGLAHELEGVLRLETHAREWSTHDYWRGAIAVDGNRLVFPKPLARGNLLESIFIWQQLWWADVASISFA